MQLISQHAMSEIYKSHRRYAYVAFGDLIFGIAKNRFIYECIGLIEYEDLIFQYDDCLHYLNINLEADRL